ncbi:MAG: type I-C CRISPR-associated protein Cas8c/Csd1 [Deltaproteobacteria bacterium]|nr:type I-C CRISPR-associated protein Cas8c/Csd1 [Deltaproteobacteria bacterium]MBW2075397.1 type I-C CRISPR-associated protein Cas8c/Csd1 [Deltaproteobacteria bacterium]
MIFESLVEYYDRLERKGAVPPFGFSIEDIGFAITLSRDGDIVGEPIDLRKRTEMKGYEYKQSVVPYTNKVNARSSNAANVPNFMVDKADYVFGMSGNTKKEAYHEAFKKLVYEVCGSSGDEGVLAVKRFLEKWKSAESPRLPFWKDISGTNAKWVAFKLEGENRFIHERPEVKRLWAEYLKRETYKKGYSFVEGDYLPLQTQYAQFKFGSGASLVSFNRPAYESYGKNRGENAPISVMAEFKSATALKHLLRSRKQRITIGGTTTLFWTQRDSPMESFMGHILNPHQEGPDNARLEKFLDAAKKGHMPREPSFDGDVKFYILGFSVNEGRLAVRYWLACSVARLMERIGRHFMDLEVERHSEGDIPYPGIWHLLRLTARDAKDIPPLLGGALLRSILEGVKYPMNLYHGVLNRIKAEQSKRDTNNVNYLRASVLKAVLKRNFNMEVPMSLDANNRDTGYLLGRLFAVLEKAQRDALGENINATIKDRFYGSASTTPASVLPGLIRLAGHHIQKAKYGAVSERRIEEIMEHLDHFPTHLTIQQQGMFHIGYYHQRNEFYRKQKPEQVKEDSNE